VVFIVAVDVGDDADIKRVVGGHDTGNALHVIVAAQSLLSFTPSSIFELQIIANPILNTQNSNRIFGPRQTNQAKLKLSVKRLISTPSFYTNQPA